MLFLLAVGQSEYAQVKGQKAEYVGSESCRSCHRAEYDGWKQTRMANVVRDPKEHPEAVLADFTHADPLVTFDLKDQGRGIVSAPLICLWSATRSSA